MANLDFSAISSIAIPEGNVTNISVNGVSIWSANAGRLPAGYTELEYIENADVAEGTKKCYITLENSGITKGVDELDLYYQLLRYDTRDFCGCDGTRYTQFLFSRYAYLWNDYKNVGDLSNSLHHIQVTTTELLVDGVSQLTLSSGTYTTGDICVGIQNPNPQNRSSAVGRFGEFIIKKAGVAIYDLVPCQRDSDGLCGFYDIVNDEFRPSEGADNWTAPVVA